MSENKYHNFHSEVQKTPRTSFHFSQQINPQPVTNGHREVNTCPQQLLRQLSYPRPAVVTAWPPKNHSLNRLTMVFRLVLLKKVYGHELCCMIILPAYQSNYCYNVLEQIRKLRVPTATAADPTSMSTDRHDKEPRRPAAQLSTIVMWVKQMAVKHPFQTLPWGIKRFYFLFSHYRNKVKLTSGQLLTGRKKLCCVWFGSIHSVSPNWKKVKELWKVTDGRTALKIEKWLDFGNTKDSKRQSVHFWYSWRFSKTRKNGNSSNHKD